MKYTFVILGEPVAKGRPRMSRLGGIYTPKRTVVAEAHIRAQIAQQMGSMPLQGPIRMSVLFVSVKPKSVPKSRVYPTVKPDMDNLLKTALDAMNGVVYRDDVLVVELHARKEYGSAPRTEITLEEI